MNEELINEGYLDMLIQQSYSNEEKAGAKADSVASKLEYIKSQILQDHEIVNRLRELDINELLSDYIHASPKLTKFFIELQKIVENEE